MHINKMVAEVHENAEVHGWWETPPSFGDLIALCHSELSEALEEYRKGMEPSKQYHSCPSHDKRHLCRDMYDGCRQGENAGCTIRKPEGIPSELADVVIRIMDMCGHYGINLEVAILEKHEYNKTRTYKHGSKVL